MWPYNLNPIADKWGRTRNWDDSLGIYQDAHGNGYNPEFELVKVGAGASIFRCGRSKRETDLSLLLSVLQQGLIGYITVGVDSNANYDVNAVRPHLLRGGIPVRVMRLYTECLSFIQPWQPVPENVAARLKTQQ